MNTIDSIIINIINNINKYPRGVIAISNKRFEGNRNNTIINIIKTK